VFVVKGKSRGGKMYPLRNGGRHSLGEKGKSNYNILAGVASIPQGGKGKE